MHRIIYDREYKKPQRGDQRPKRWNIQCTKDHEKNSGNKKIAAAAMERKDTTVEKLKEELLDKIKEDLKKHESNIVERR